MRSVSSPAGAADPSKIGRDDPTAGPAAVDQLDQLPDDPPDLDRPSPVELTDQMLAVARAAAVEEAGSADLVGEYLGAVADDDVAVSAAFSATDKGYRGWYWSVTLAVVDTTRPTVSEVVLLPGQQALLAPPWVPWERRIRPGDVGPGDLLPAPADDIRLVPGYVDSDDPAVKEVAYEFGFGRERVLSREGRDDAAERWHEGSFGPGDPLALAAPANCVTCGFYVPLAGLLGTAFGACTNEFSPADGRVVDAGFGCGAHSQTVIDAPMISAATDTVIDELTLEVHQRFSRRPERAPGDAAVAASEPVDDPDLFAEVDVRWGVPDREPETDPSTEDGPLS
jgi:hypothetical protein